MTATVLAPGFVDNAPEASALDYARALENMLDDFASAQDRLWDTQKAMLNILEDSAGIQAALVKSGQLIRSSLQEKETLLKEVHHRVKNNLQLIVSLLRLQSRKAGDGRVRAMFEESQNRVLSISLVHDMLYQAGEVVHVELGDYLRSLAAQLVRGWTAAAIELSVAASPVHFAPDIAVPCGLIVNELVTNALKHAFPDRASGAIRVSLDRAPDGRLKLSVQDDGVGLPERLEPGSSGGLGLELVAALVRQLQGTLEIHRNAGTAFDIYFQAVG